MGILLPCDLSTWPSVVSYLNVLTSGLDSIQDVIVVLLQIHDLCNISIFNDEDDARYGKYQLWSFKLEIFFLNSQSFELSFLFRPKISSLLL